MKWLPICKLKAWKPNFWIKSAVITVPQSLQFEAYLLILFNWKVTIDNWSEPTLSYKLKVILQLDHEVSYELRLNWKAANLCK